MSSSSWATLMLNIYDRLKEEIKQYPIQQMINSTYNSNTFPKSQRWQQTNGSHWLPTHIPWVWYVKLPPFKTRIPFPDIQHPIEITFKNSIGSVSLKGYVVEIYKSMSSRICGTCRLSPISFTFSYN